MPKVYNKRRPREIPEGAVYVGRPSPWGNPYKVSRNKTREQAIREFQTYAELKDFYEEHWLEPLRGKDLVCWCSPGPCHADVLLRMANEDIETKRARHAEIGWPSPTCTANC